MSVREKRGPGRALRTGAGGLISVGLLILLFGSTDIDKVWAQLHAFPVWSVLVSVGITLGCIPLRALQWQWLLGNPEAVRFSQSMSNLSLGYLGNCLLPMRGGELVRTYLLARATSLTISRVFVSVVLSRAQDFPPILLLLTLVLNRVDLGQSVVLGGAGFLDTPVEIPAAQLTGALHAFAVAVGIAAVALIVGFIWLVPIERLLLRLTAWLPNTLAERLEKQITQGVEAIGVVRRPRLFWGAQLLSLLGWTIFVSVGVPLLMALGIEPGEAFDVSVVVLGMTVIAQMLPSLPGAVGTFHAACVMALRLMRPEIELSSAIAFALVFHFVSTLVPGIVGLLYLPSSWEQFLRALARRRTAD